MSEQIPTRDGFGSELVALGKENENVVGLSGDLEDATRAEFFKFEYPDRFFNVGIAEQDMIGMAAGLAKEGLIPYACSFAVFTTNRAYDMIRLDVCYNNCNVKLVCSHGGVTVGEDGASAQCLEDFAIMRVLPNMTVVCPVDTIEAAKATRLMSKIDGPFYMRTSRAPFPVLTGADDPFEFGKANVMRNGDDVTLIACGIMVSQSLKAAEILAGEGIQARVLNMHTIKPLDTRAIVAAAKETGAIVTAEEHQIHGGLSGAVAEVLGQTVPVPQEIVAVQDTFGRTGSPDQLMAYFHLTDEDIAQAARRALKRKTS